MASVERVATITTTILGVDWMLNVGDEAEMLQEKNLTVTCIVYCRELGFRGKEVTSSLIWERCVTVGDEKKTGRGWNSWHPSLQQAGPVAH